jgi:hypothetical protein
MVAGASVEEAFTAAASVGMVFEVEAFTAVLPVEALEVGVFAVVLTLLAFAAAFVVMAFAEVAFMAVAFMAVGDANNQSVYQGSAGYTDQLVGQIQLRLARGDYYYSSIDGVGDDGTRRVIREHKRAHALPEDVKIG